MFLFQLVAKIWHKVHFMNSTAAIFDFITLEVAKKIDPHFVLSLSHANAESSGNSLLTNI